MKSKSWRVHYWCNNALSDCHSNQVWQCQWNKAEREICRKVCCMFRVFVLLNKPAASSFPHFHYCCGSPGVLFGNCLVDNYNATGELRGTTAMMELRKWRRNEMKKWWKWRMKSTSACTDTKARYCLSRDGGVAGWTSRGGGEGEVTCLRFSLSHRRAKLKIYKWVNPWHYSKNGCITAVERATT